jgi:hypothetical protein
MNVLLRCILLYLYILITACEHNSYSDKDQNKLVLVESDGQIISVYAVDEKGTKVSYRPENDSAEEMPGFYFKEAISPDGKWVVLPSGKFEGFVCLKKENLIESFKARKYPVEISVMGQSSKLRHTFLGWQSPSKLLFKVSLSDDQDIACDFDLETNSSSVAKKSFFLYLNGKKVNPRN